MTVSLGTQCWIDAAEDNVEILGENVRLVGRQCIAPIIRPVHMAIDSPDPASY